MRHLITILSLLMLAACDPMGPLPGGALSGEPQAPPIDWDKVRSIETFQFETRPGDPYSINIWGVEVDQHFYLAAGDGEGAKWVAHLRANPAVRLRVGTLIYELHAQRITDEFELRAVRERYTEKYELDADANMASEAWVYRLDPR